MVMGLCCENSWLPHRHSLSALALNSSMSRVLSFGVLWRHFLFVQMAGDTWTCSLRHSFTFRQLFRLTTPSHANAAAFSPLYSTSRLYQHRYWPQRSLRIRLRGSVRAGAQFAEGPRALRLPDDSSLVFDDLNLLAASEKHVLLLAYFGTNEASHDAGE